MRMILASASPRRAALFRQLRIPFQIDPSSFDESTISESDPEKLVQLLAEKKGGDVARRHSNCLLVAADTIVCLNGNILGKPAGDDDAKNMLRRLSGNTHQVYSGVYAAKLAGDGAVLKHFTFSKRTNVTFSALDDTEIELYVATKSPLDKAGAYGIQDDSGSLFVQKIEGDYYNVVGFPLNAFYNNLKQQMPDVFTQFFLSPQSL